MIWSNKISSTVSGAKLSKWKRPLHVIKISGLSCCGVLAWVRSIHALLCVQLKNPLFSGFAKCGLVENFLHKIHWNKTNLGWLLLIKVIHLVGYGVGWFMGIAESIVAMDDGCGRTRCSVVVWSNSWDWVQVWPCADRHSVHKDICTTLFDQASLLHHV